MTPYYGDIDYPEPGIAQRRRDTEAADLASVPASFFNDKLEKKRGEIGDIQEGVEEQAQDVTDPSDESSEG